MNWWNVGLVFVVGILAALGTGLGTIPLFWLRDVSTRVEVGLWGLAGGLMASASVFGLLAEAISKHSNLLVVGVGFLAGCGLVIGSHELVDRFGGEASAEDIAQADFETFLNVLVVLFVHSFPEGVAIGVSFAALGSGAGVSILGFSIPVLAIVIPGALAIHNIPEGLAVGIPLRRNDGVSRVQLFSAAVFTSLPQPVAAVISFVFVRIAIQFLGFGYGFAAGAMLYLVVDDVLPEGLEDGESLPSGGVTELAVGIVIGVLGMLPLLLYT